MIYQDETIDAALDNAEANYLNMSNSSTLINPSYIDAYAGYFLVPDLPVSMYTK